MNRDHKILVATVASGLMIGALVPANSTETEVCVSKDTCMRLTTYSHAIDLPSYDLSEDKISDHVDYQIARTRQTESTNEIIDEMDVWPNLDYSRVVNQFLQQPNQRSHRRLSTGSIRFTQPTQLTQRFAITSK